MNSENTSKNIFTYKKAMVNFKIYDITDCKTSNFNTRIAQYLEK